MDKNVKRMLADIEAEVKYTRSLTGLDALSPRVIEAISQVPRERFVPETIRKSAYDNGPLPIGQGQTISQPYMVALMTDLLDVHKHHRVLEIGTGSGYQSAVLSLLCAELYSVELIPLLSQQAEQRLKQLGYSNVKTFIGDGYRGLPEYAPYDRIMVTAAANHVPHDLIDQLKPDSRLVIPIGEPYSHQELALILKDAQGNISRKNILPVAFVPFRHEENN